MALERPLPVWTARLSLGEGVTTGTLLVQGGLDWLGATPEALADRVRSRLQGRLERGESPRVALDALPELREVRPATLTIDLPRRADGAPAARVELPAALAEAREGTWIALAPGLGASWPGTSPEEALAGLRERVTLQLLAEDPRKDGATLLDLVQAQDLEVVREEREFSFPTFAELRAARKARGRLLPKVTSPWRPSPPGAFGLGATLEAAGRAVQMGRSVLVVGPGGGGKTELVRELVRTRTTLDGLREIDAPGLLLALMEEGTWQEPLARLAGELAESGTWLYVHHLAELFEVGRYEGNEVSLAEALRGPIGRGEVRLLAEATPEEVAAIEARHPGHLEPWTRVTLQEPRLDEVVAAWAAARGPGLKVRFEREALTEILRLHRRFTPYSGQPGKSLRFLAALAGEDHGGTIGREEVLVRFCAETGLSRAIVDPRSPLAYETIHSLFAERVFGQPEAVAATADALAAAKADVARWGKPLASLLLVGPTGVGKTETARAAAAFLFGDSSRLVRFDMSEYASAGAVARLVGGPAYEGTLTGAVRRQPFAVVLFDEVEKAHPAFLDLLLQVLGEGRLTDGRGRTADFSSTLVLLTSNVGAVEARRRGAGFTGGAGMEDRFRDAVAAWLRPELLNRLDRVVAFSPLTPDAIARVLDRELARFRTRPGLEGRPFTLAPEVRALLAEEGYRPAWGARALLRAVHDRLAAPVATALDDRKDPRPASVSVTRSGDRLHVRLDASDARPAEELGVAVLHGEAREARVRVRQILDGAVYAEREAELQSFERAWKGRSSHGDPAPLRALLARVRVVTETARSLERDVGVAALAGREDAGFSARLRQLRADTLDVARRLVESAKPETSICIVAVYGQRSVDELVGLYTRVGEAAGLAVEARSLCLREDAPLHLVDPKEPPPEGLGERVGVELRVTGAGAWFLYADEPGVTQFPPDVRVRTLVVASDRAAWERARPKDVHRKLFFNERPRRVVGDRVQEREARLSWPSLRELGEHLLQGWLDRLAGELG